MPEHCRMPPSTESREVDRHKMKVCTALSFRYSTKQGCLTFISHVTFCHGFKRAFQRISGGQPPHGGQPTGWHRPGLQGHPPEALHRLASAERTLLSLDPPCASRLSAAVVLVPTANLMPSHCLHQRQSWLPAQCHLLAIGAISLLC